MASPIVLPDPPVLEPIADDRGRTSRTWQAWLFLLRAAVLSTITAASAQLAIQFKNAGVNLGTAGTVTSLDVVGPDLVATRSVDAVTITQTRPTISLTGDVTGSGTVSIAATVQQMRMAELLEAALIY